MTPAVATSRVRRWAYRAALAVAPLWALTRVAGLETNMPAYTPATQLLAFTPYVAVLSLIPLATAAIRREWRSVAVALVATVALVTSVLPRAVGDGPFAAARSGGPVLYALILIEHGTRRAHLAAVAQENHRSKPNSYFRAPHPAAPRAKSGYLREDRVLAKLPLLHHRLAAADQQPSTAGTTTTSSGATASAARPIPPTPQEVITHLRERALELRYDPEARTLEAGVEHRVRVTI